MLDFLDVSFNSVHLVTQKRDGMLISESSIGNDCFSFGCALPSFSSLDWFLSTYTGEESLHEIRSSTASFNILLLRDWVLGQGRRTPHLLREASSSVPKERSGVKSANTPGQSQDNMLLQVLVHLQIFQAIDHLAAACSPDAIFQKRKCTFI